MNVNFSKSMKRFRLIPFKWLILVNAIVVAAAVCSFGLVAFFGMGLQEGNDMLTVPCLALFGLLCPYGNPGSSGVTPKRNLESAVKLFEFSHIFP